MTLTIPDSAETAALTPDELRLELACALYSRGRIGMATATNMASVDFIVFQRALGERGISITTAEKLDEDVETLRELFPE